MEIGPFAVSAQRMPRLLHLCGTWVQEQKWWVSTVATGEQVCSLLFNSIQGSTVFGVLFKPLPIKSSQSTLLNMMYYIAVRR